MFLVFDVDPDLITDSKEALIEECSKCYPDLVCKDFLFGSVIAVMKGTRGQLDALVKEIETKGFMTKSVKFGGVFSSSTFKGKSDEVCACPVKSFRQSVAPPACIISFCRTCCNSKCTDKQILNFLLFEPKCRCKLQSMPS